MVLKRKRARDFDRYQRLGTLRTVIVLPVSSRGGETLGITIPSDVVKLNGVISGDWVRVSLLDHYRERKEE